MECCGMVHNEAQLKARSDHKNMWLVFLNTRGWNEGKQRTLVEERRKDCDVIAVGETGWHDRKLNGKKASRQRLDEEERLEKRREVEQE